MGVPGISVPALVPQGQLPVGLQFLAPTGKDSELLAFAGCIRKRKLNWNYKTYLKIKGKKNSMTGNTLVHYPKLIEITKKYDVVIGIEVHCQLATKSKMFSTSKTLMVIPRIQTLIQTCLGLPGALPTINQEAVDLAIRMGLALKSEIQHVSVFARKNYFYPDLPKGY